MYHLFNVYCVSFSSIIAVNYEARDRGVTRHMRGDEAKKHCPEIELVSVPSVRGKADLTKYEYFGLQLIYNLIGCLLPTAFLIFPSRTYLQGLSFPENLLPMGTHTSSI